MTEITTPTTSRYVVREGFHSELDALYRTCAASEMNKPDTSLVLIAACLDEGLTAEAQIIATVASASGFDKRHIGGVLNNHRGHLWAKEAKHYRALPALQVI